MYSHGLATLALCEAWAMTRQAPQPQPPAMPWQAGSDPSRVEPVGFASSAGFSQEDLRDAAQGALAYIEYAQHSGGGWRYQPKQPGDTSVVGWQMMALKSGYLGGLDVTPDTVARAVKFLDHVADDRIGSTYGYTNGNRRRVPSVNAGIGATTPIGLLCRMYTGWERDHKGMTAGVERLRRWARPGQGMYFYYYAAQVMHHYNGAPWKDWNDWMRDYLVESQSRTGSESGSWNFSGNHDSGRLYCTSMAAMSLEVYYRYSPIYGVQAVNAEEAAAWKEVPAP
jgi:hypothetical protein